MTAPVLTPLAGVAIPSIETLTRNAARYLQEQMAQTAQVQVDTTETVSATDLAVARANITAAAFAQAMGVHGIYRYMRDFLSRQAIPIYSGEEFLDGWMSALALQRKTAVMASGMIIGTGTAGATLPAGAEFTRPGSGVLRVVADVLVAVDGSWQAQVMADQPGKAGNVDAGTHVALAVSIDGIDPDAHVDDDGITGGAPVEGDSDAVYRVQQRLGNEPAGGAPADYARWALKVPGITRAWGVRNPAGPTSAGVIILADGTDDGLPTAAMRDAVIDYIRDPMRGPPDELFVIIPTLTAIDFSLTLTPDSADRRSVAVAALDELFAREAIPGGSIPHAYVWTALDAAVGSGGWIVNSPALVSGQQFMADPLALLARGDVTFTAP